jgi:hypothetical protein
MNEFLQELQQQAQALRQQAKAFAADSRQDDADFAKIEANIYEVCATIGNVVCKIAPEGQREALYRKKLSDLPHNWQIALEAAEAHGNFQRAQVEKRKLAALEDVLARLDGRGREIR